MKRRSFGLLAGTSLVALKFSFARGQVVADASLLKTKLTPFGSDPAGNADGSIPAWTGGYTTPPEGWQVGQFVPDPNETDTVVAKIDASNMAQYADKLSVGTTTLMTKYSDFFINVYRTHRTAAAPQDVYDNIAANVGRARFDPVGPQYGVLGAIGGIPFPILDTSDPLIAGVQTMWNNLLAWKGRAMVFRSYGWAVSSGQPYLSDESPGNYDYPYYRKGADAATFGDGIYLRTFEQYSAPANDVGEEIDTAQYVDITERQDQVWELLNGQGRVRKAPEVSYDTPAAQVDGLADTDEYYGFNGQLDRYNWKHLGKKELYIPYNNNTLFGMPPLQVIGAHFFDPQYVRWELHRVHVVEATLRPGKRNTLARRVLYLDEDTWEVAAVDAYDGNDSFVHVNLSYFITRPDLPGTFLANNSVHNLQTGDWTPMSGMFDEKARPSIQFLDSLPDSMFDPTNMAAGAQY